MWSAVIVGIEALPVFRDRSIALATTYTTLGYGEGTLPKRGGFWPRYRVSGLFAFGWTTSVLFHLVTQASLLRAQRAAVKLSQK
jgi:hypothetical protein